MKTGTRTMTKYARIDIQLWRTPEMASRYAAAPGRGGVAREDSMVYKIEHQLSSLRVGDEPVGQKLAGRSDVRRVQHVVNALNMRNKKKHGAPIYETKSWPDDTNNPDGSQWIGITRIK